MVLLALFVLFASLGAGPPALAESKAPSLLDQLPLSGGVMVMSDTRGRMASWEPEAKRLITWTAKGARERLCVLDDPQLTGSPGLMGYSNDRVLATFFDVSLSESGERRRAAVIDVIGCRVTKALSLPDIVQAVQPSRDGWLVTVVNPGTPRFRIVAVSMLGLITGELELPEELRGELASKFQHVGAYNVLAVDAGRETWLVSRGIYSFWRPRQHGRPEHSFRPSLDCIGAEGRELSGEESKKEFERVFASAQGPTKQWAARASQRMGGASKGFIGAIAGATSNGDLVALAVRGVGQDRTCRIDVWDVSLEKLRGVFPISVPMCPAMLALADEAIWFASAGSMRRVELPPLEQAVKDPCEKTKGKPIVSFGEPETAVLPPG